MKPIKILSLDSGGIRGTIQAQFLLNLEILLKITHNKNTTLGDYFDLIVGTSTGGILTALYLLPDKKGNYKFTASDVVDFYFKESQNIFSNSFLYKLKSGFNLFDSKYNTQTMKDVTDRYFKEYELKDLLKPCIITAYDLTYDECVLFKQHKAIKDTNFNFNLSDVVRSTISAPSYFNPVIINDKKLIDGGVFSTNPILCAFSEAHKNYNIEDVKIMSIGCGIHKNGANINKDGLVGWIRPISDIMMNSTARISEYYMNILETDNYYRFNTCISKEQYKIDNIKEDNIIALKNIGQKMFDDNYEKINNFINL